MKTTNLKLPRARWYDLSPPVAATIVIFCLLLIGLIVGRVRSAPSAAAAPTPGLIILIATAPAAIVPTAVPAAQVAALAPNALRRAVVAWDSPNGNVIGAIEQGRAYTVLARFGSDWLQADVAGSGIVWLKADQVLDLPAGLADLEPTDPPVIVDRPIYVSAPAEAAPTPAAEPYQELPTMAPQTAAVLDRGAWAAQAATARAGR